MPNKCYVDNCPSASGKGLILHSLPKDPNLIQKWITNLNNLNNQFPTRIAQSAKFCYLHFEPSCYEKIGFQNARLIPGSVPTKFGKSISKECENMDFLYKMKNEPNVKPRQYVTELPKEIETENSIKIENCKSDPLFLPKFTSNSTKIVTNLRIAGRPTINNELISQSLVLKIKEKNNILQRYRNKLCRQNKKIQRLESILSYLKTKDPTIIKVIKEFEQTIKNEK